VQPRKQFEVLGCNGITHDHQPVGFGALGGVELGQGLGRASQDAHFGSKNLAFEIIVRDLPFLGVEHGHRHE